MKQLFLFIWLLCCATHTKGQANLSDLLVAEEEEEILSKKLIKQFEADTRKDVRKLQAKKKRLGNEKRLLLYVCKYLRCK